MPFLCAPAAADGSIDLSTTVVGLPSAAGIYGPVTEQHLAVRLPPDARLGFEFTNRTTKDTFNPSHTFGASADYFRRWTPRFSSYARISTASGPPAAARSLYLQGDLTGGHGFVASAGAGVSSLYGIGVYRIVKLGGTYYHGDGYASVTYTSGWSPLIGNTQSYLASLALGHPGRTTETFYWGTGSETDISVLNPSNPSLTGERESGSSIAIKHWVNPGAGYHVAFEWGTLNRADGTQIFQRRAITAGAFIKLGP